MDSQLQRHLSRRCICWRESVEELDDVGGGGVGGRTSSANEASELELEGACVEAERHVVV